MLKVNRRGVPMKALGISALATGLSVLINYLMPGEAFGLLMALAVSALVINWGIISITHLKFRKAMRANGHATFFPSWGYPITNWVCLAFLAAILVIMYMTPGIRISVLLIPVWLGVLAVAWMFKKRQG